MAAKKTAYNRAFGGGTDNLWETVDTIMVDLLHQGGDNSSGITYTDAEIEKNNITKKKEKELDEMMENLDTLLDDLKDISAISNDTTTPPRSINSSAEKVKPKRATHDEFLEKENPLDSITQGLLYQTSDVPLFASSEVPAPGADSSAPQSEDEGESEEELEEVWGDELAQEQQENNAKEVNNSEEGEVKHENERPTSDLGASSDEVHQLPLEQLMAEKDLPKDKLDEASTGNAEGTARERGLTSRLYAAATKAEAIRRMDVKDRISKYQELSKITEASRQKTEKNKSVHHSVAFPSNSYRSRPFSTSSSVLARSSPPVSTARPLPRGPNALNIDAPSNPSRSPNFPRKKNSPLTSPTATSASGTSPNLIPINPAPTAPGSPRSLPPIPSSPKPVRPPRPNAPHLQKGQSITSDDTTQSLDGKPRLNSILNEKAPALPSDPSPKRPPKKIPHTFAPSTRSSESGARSQINIGARQLRTSGDGSPTPPFTSPPSPTESSVLSTSPIPIPSSDTGTAFSSSSSSSSSPTPLDLESPSSLSPSDSVLQKEVTMRRVLSSPTFRESQHNPSFNRVSSQGAIPVQKSLNPTHLSTPPSTSPPALSLKAAKSLRLTPVGQHRTPTRLIFGGEGISVQIPNVGARPNAQPSSSPLAQASNAQEASAPLNSEPETQGITARHAAPGEVKERNAKIKQLRDLMRRYRTKLLHMETKHSRDAQDLSTRINTGSKDAQIQLRSCVSWGQNVLTRSCRASWHMKMFVLQYRYDLHMMQATLLQAKLELVDQLMTLLEIEYKNTGSSAAKNDFVIYSSFFKDPSEVMTSPEVERKSRLLPRLMRSKRRLKLEFQRLRTAYQPEPPDRRVRRVKDILVRMNVSPLLPSYYAQDDILQADFDSVVTDQRLLEGRHIQHLKNFLQEDLAGEHTITPGEITDFLQQFAHKMAEMFGVTAQDASKLLLLSKRAIYPRIYQLLVQGIPASVEEQDLVLRGQLRWLQSMDPVKLRQGLRLDERVFQTPNAIAAFEPAIEALNELAFLIVPTDMAVAVHRAFKLTHDITQAQMRLLGGSTEMGMDDVFPMFLWVVTQCNVGRLCQCVYFLDFFSDSDEKISILGYSATSLAAAVAHLGLIEREVFDVVQ